MRILSRAVLHASWVNLIVVAPVLADGFQRGDWKAAIEGGNKAAKFEVCENKCKAIQDDADIKGLCQALSTVMSDPRCSDSDEAIVKQTALSKGLGPRIKCDIQVNDSSSIGIGYIVLKKDGAEQGRLTWDANHFAKMDRDDWLYGKQSHKGFYSQLESKQLCKASPVTQEIQKPVQYTCGDKPNQKKELMFGHKFEQTRTGLVIIDGTNQQYLRYVKNGNSGSWYQCDNFQRISAANKKVLSEEVNLTPAQAKENGCSSMAGAGEFSLSLEQAFSGESIPMANVKVRNNPPSISFGASEQGAPPDSAKLIYNMEEGAEFEVVCKGKTTPIKVRGSGTGAAEEPAAETGGGGN